MIQENNDIRDNFKENVNSVYKLMNFDDIIQSFCLKALEKAERGLKKFGAEEHPSFSVEQDIKNIRNIRANKSLRTSYEVMFNQCVVLLVSYFSSAIEDIFQLSLTYKIKKGQLNKLGKEEIKISLNDLQEIDFNVLDNIGQIIVAKKDISFQDMKSIARAVNNHFGFEPAKDKNVNNIILSQACRHSIVHSSGVIKDKIAKQISSAKPRDLKQELKAKDEVLFNPDEIKIIAESMLHYIDKLVKDLNEQFENISESLS